MTAREILPIVLCLNGKSELMEPTAGRPAYEEFWLVLYKLA